MAALRDGSRWIVPTADTVYQRAAFKCAVRTQCVPTCGALFGHRLWKAILVAILIVRLLSRLCLCVYELLPSTQSHKAAADFICWIHVINSQRPLRALGSGHKGGRPLRRVQVELAHDFSCWEPIFRQVSRLKGIRNAYRHTPEGKDNTAVYTILSDGFGFHLCSLWQKCSYISTCFIMLCSEIWMNFIGFLCDAPRNNSQVRFICVARFSIKAARNAFHHEDLKTS